MHSVTFLLVLISCVSYSIATLSVYDNSTITCSELSCSFNTEACTVSSVDSPDCVETCTRMRCAGYEATYKCSFTVILHDNVWMMMCLPRTVVYQSDSTGSSGSWVPVTATDCIPLHGDGTNLCLSSSTSMSQSHGYSSSSSGMKSASSPTRENPLCHLLFIITLSFVFMIVI